VSQTCSQTPFTQRPILQPALGVGFTPQDSAGLELQICSQAPSTQRPILQPRSGRGLTPQDSHAGSAFTFMGSARIAAASDNARNLSIYISFQ